VRSLAGSRSLAGCCEVAGGVAFAGGVWRTCRGMKDLPGYEGLAGVMAGV
jgi:hypothetical protein